MSFNAPLLVDRGPLGPLDDQFPVDAICYPSSIHVHHLPYDLVGFSFAILKRYSALSNVMSHN